MKTSFAEFSEFPFGNNSMTVKTFVDCEQVKAVRQCFDFDLNPIDDRTELVIGMQQNIVVEGSVDDVLLTVKAFCGGQR